MKKVLLLNFLFLFTILGQVAAQSRTITGKVTGAGDGASLPGVSVIVKGTTTGTATNADGSFSVNVPDGANTLVFRYIGYVAKEVAIGTNASINVVLELDDKQLSEVVVVAYGTADKGSFVGSAGQVTVEKIAQRPVTNISNAVAGQIAGVQTNSGSGQPGEGPAIRIRGISSVNSSNTPLYVVDGVPYSGTLGNLNPEDIADITVLKDASSTSLYGSRAANGVVMITTKRGTKNRNEVSFKALQGVVTRALPEYDRVNAYQYYPLAWEAYRNSMHYSGTRSLEDANRIASIGGTAANGNRINSIYNNLGYNPFNVPNDQIVMQDGTLNPDARLIYSEKDLDWFEPLSRTGSRGDYAVTLNGGSDKSDYFVSLGYLNEKGFVTRSDYERFTGRVNLNASPKKWLSTGLNLSGNITQSNQASDESSSGYVNPFYFARTMGPIFPVYAQKPETGEFILDEAGNKIYDLGNMNELGLPNRPAGASPGRHVVAETQLNEEQVKRNVLSARTFAEISFLNNFKFRTNLAGDITNYEGISYQNTLVGDGAPAGRASRTLTTTSSYTLNQLLSYANTFGDKHNVDVLVGHENYDYNYNYNYGFRQGEVLAGNIELDNFASVNSLRGYKLQHRIESYFSRVNYNFDNKYTVSASFRRDGSSKFDNSVRWGNFWSIGGAWRIDNETFITMPEWVNMLKLRSSYGEVGNDGVLTSGGSLEYYPSQGLYGSGPGFNNGAEPGFLLSNLASPNLTWESSGSFDVGLDFALFSKLNGHIEFFNRQSSNMLFRVPLPVSSGVLDRNLNIGTMYNRGVEVQLSADVIERDDFGWNVDFNWTALKNRITKMPEGQEEIISGTKKLKEGKDLYAYWLRQWYGVDPENGNPLYLAETYNPTNSKILANGDTVTTSVNNARFDYSGSAIPDFTGGITNTFRYKNFSLSILATYQVGGKMYDGSYATLMTHGAQYGGALHSDILNRWTPENPNTNVPRLDVSNAPDFAAGTSNRWLVDASYLNIRNATLTYSVPSSISSRFSIQNARIYASGENLHLFSARKGMNVGQSFTGVTSNSYTPARVLSLGLNVTL
ncbi:TonB-dependent receptor [Pontibacter sp. FD36]|uniref:SusC/RagA family TonB-linked outer membrane protein n=1 Tax=Pontibacter sp. FD36 TaxID=2789860 RepID=UPI0018AC46E7|nr:TonB-dependent receptor [Pontibacter sp. FD36]MBF8964842.1 TonB-dependent receptor [Pontibacter sp. FD36]